jgi:DNA polymerase-2
MSNVTNLTGREFTGWFLDVYSDSRDGAVAWFLADHGTRYRLHQPFPVTFYAAGPLPRLRAAWEYLQKRSGSLQLDRTVRQDLFSGFITVMQITVPDAADQPRLFRDLAECFPDLDYYDADIAFPLRFVALNNIFPLARCAVQADETGQLVRISALDTPWDLDTELPPLNILTIRPNCDPARCRPAYLDIHSGRLDYRLALEHERPLLIGLNAIFKRHDPDLVLTYWGDTWLFPYLLNLSKKSGLAFNPNRDPQCEILQKKERSFFTYGQIIYRGRQAHLFGRWHVDACNGMMFGEYGLEGVFEQARVTGLPVQTVARNSPGSGITAMQIGMAVRKGILVPYQKQQVERFKTARELIYADNGGLVYQPVVGLHRDVAVIDFFSMYPQLMEHFNISPETVDVTNQDAVPVPGLGISVDQSRTGFVPETLSPLLKKRFTLKERLLTLDPRDCRYKPCKARVAALKWLLVVCFGYLGYKNARFGRIESHQAVTAYGREVLLRAKEAAEDLGFDVLHLYVDSLFVRKPGAARSEDFQPLLNEIVRRTGIPITLDGIFRWAAFLPSRVDDRVPVANRYFGLFQDGSFKVRGIELRRGDTCKFIAGTQSEILEILSQAFSVDELPQMLPRVAALLRRRLTELRSYSVPEDQLVVIQKVSRSPDEYRTPSPAARAAAQLVLTGKSIRPGQHVKFLFTCGKPGVWAWDLTEQFDIKSLDVKRYADLLLRAASTVLQPLGVTEQDLRGGLVVEGAQARPRQGALPLYSGGYGLGSPGHPFNALGRARAARDQIG